MYYNLAYNYMIRHNFSDNVAYILSTIKFLNYKLDRELDYFFKNDKKLSIAFYIYLDDEKTKKCGLCYLDKAHISIHKCLMFPYSMSIDI